MGSKFEREHNYLKQIGGIYLDNNFYIITAKRAGMLCKGYGVPRHGYERLVELDGMRFIIARSVHNRKHVWTARPDIKQEFEHYR